MSFVKVSNKFKFKSNNRNYFWTYSISVTHALCRKMNLPD
uniref:Uncharacterized protein n=1 Tax=Anguilla anguilla TaxID=7936 RepID=A0A0E9VM16_ANGAN